MQIHADSPVTAEAAGPDAAAAAATTGQLLVHTLPAPPSECMKN